MPPRVRNRATKTLKENIGASENKLTSTRRTAKGPRKALADKTNSVSDDNISEEINLVAKKVTTKALKVEVKRVESKNIVRPRRDRRLPTRFVENQVLTSLSNSKDLNVSPTNAEESNTDKTPIGDSLYRKLDGTSTPFKTPANIETSIVEHRSRRICRLPSQFEDYSVSPSKYIPIQPTNASTPIQPNNKSKLPIVKTGGKKSPVKRNPGELTSKVLKDVFEKQQTEVLSDKSSPDTNNNAKGRARRVKKTINTQPLKKVNVKKITSIKTFQNQRCSLESKVALKTTTPQHTRPKRNVVTNKVADNSTILDDSLHLADKLQTSTTKDSRSKRKLLNRNKAPHESSSFEVSPESQEALKTPIPQHSKPKNKVSNKNVANLSSSFQVTIDPVKNLKTPVNKMARCKKQINPNKAPNKSSSFEVSPESQKALKTPTPKTGGSTKVTIGKRVLRQTSLVEALNKQKSQNLLKTISPKKISPKGIRLPSPKKVNLKGKRLIDNNLSFKVLENKKKSQDSEKDDIYEFTFDPNEEPKPLKKKRKKAVTKRPTKPRTVVYKTTYERNISRALNALKNAMKPSKDGVVPKFTHIQEVREEIPENNAPAINNIGKVNPTNNNKSNNTIGNDATKNSVHECNYPSIRVEDIAADIEPTVMDDHHDDICYSPVYSPEPQSPVRTPPQSPHLKDKVERSITNKDPLNLQENFSFFDDIPVASSSMNASVRHPLASPWRVEFGNLPIKWHVNTYVKPNMTPAVESSFISAQDSGRKKHVYTNLVPQVNESLPQIDTNTPNYKQTSIISFIREQAEKSAKKKRGRSVSPSKVNAIFNDIGNTNEDVTKKPTKKNSKDTSKENVSENLSSSTNDKENSKEERRTRKRKNNENICDIPAKSPRKQKDKDRTYFGFDDSENQDSENISPVKNKTGRSLRVRSRPVLQEINGPSRAVLPVTAKSKVAMSSEAINKVFDGIKSAADAPVFPENNVDKNVTNIDDPALSDDSQSVHLFEDIELIHHLKPSRKSYGKAAKKVTFQQHSTSDSESQEVIVPARNFSSDEDDLADLTFEVPNVQEKKKAKKKKTKKLRSKKEEKEAEEWAAGFNSMCEDIEEFPLVIG